jgi:hypothetical protein
VLLSVTGASGVGKSTTLDALIRAFAEQPVSCAEFDSIGVPPDADRTWRHGAVEQWVRRALDEQRAGRHLIVCGQVPVGELLAAPSADRLAGIAACVLHCSPDVRRARLVGRAERSDALADHLAFGEWLYQHTLDPGHHPEVIRVQTAAPMRWERWSAWVAGDERWRFEVIDTDALTREQAAERVVVWARDVLAGLRPALHGDWASR